VTPPFQELLDVLVLAPTGRDALLVHRTLVQQGYVCRVISRVLDIHEGIQRGMGTAIIAEEALSPASMRALASVLAGQPSWSDVPFVLLSSTSRERTMRSVRELGNVTVLDRPVQVRTLLSAVEAALRARKRQFAARAEIAQRDQFLAMLGHELRNPLGAIMFAADLLVREPALPKGSERHAQIVQRQGRHLSKLVDDLLEVSRVTTGKVVLDKRGVDLVTTLERCVSMFQERASTQNLTLDFHSQERSLVIEADPVRLEQVIGNLLTNAIKYTPEGGHIVVSLVGRDGAAVLSVRDDGIGMEPAMLEHVFDLFAQATQAIARTQGGMGIGLTLVRHLVELHDGRVEALSEGLGKGSKFVVTLPMPVHPISRAPSSLPPKQRAQSLRLVLVEDNPDLSELLKDLLEQAGHHVDVAQDGPSGVALITTVWPDCAFVDIGLPGLDGYEVAQKVRETKPDGVKLVALTGYGQHEDKQKALAAGFDEHLKKPVDIQALEKVLYKLSSTLPYGTTP
jgi:signal transduction histidine kinase/ActR/RegA family two-component response regulator